MHRTTRLFLIVTNVFVLLILVTGMAFAAPRTKAKWTVMVYMSGDNDLVPYVISDIHGITIYHISKASQKGLITPFIVPQLILPWKRAGMSSWMHMPAKEVDMHLDLRVFGLEVYGRR